MKPYHYLLLIVTTFLILQTNSSCAEEGKWEIMLDEFRINDIAHEGEYVWCATQEDGVLRYNKTDGSYTQYTTETGLASHSIEYAAERGKVPHKKSYIIAVGGASISPIIGHTYIGGHNSFRGILYTLGEFYCIGGVFAAAMSGFGENPKPRKDADRYRTWLLIIHGINIFDAYRSVKRHNEKVQRKINNLTILPDIDSGGVRIVWRF